MTTCSMKSCVKSTANSNYQKDGISFHRFPKCEKTKQKWIEATRRDDDWTPTNDSMICSIHFTEDDFQVMKSRRRLRDNSVPTLNLPVVFSMDSSIRDFVIAEYRQKMLLENNVNPPIAKAPEAEKPDDQINKKEIDKKKIKKGKASKLKKKMGHKYGLAGVRSMKLIQLLANEKLKRKKRRR